MFGCHEAIRWRIRHESSGTLSPNLLVILQRSIRSSFHLVDNKSPEALA